MKTTNQALRTGTALAITVGVGYATCALFFWLGPEAAMNLMNALFHGLDFRKLQAGAAAFNFNAFIYVLVVIMGWAFALGALFGCVQGWRGAARVG